MYLLNENAIINICMKKYTNSYEYRPKSYLSTSMLDKKKLVQQFKNTDTKKQKFTPVAYFFKI